MSSTINLCKQIGTTNVLQTSGGTFSSFLINEGGQEG